MLTGTPYFEKGTTAADILPPAGGKAPSGGDPKIPYIFYIYLSAADSNPQLNPADYFQDKALPLLKDAWQLSNQESQIGLLLAETLIALHRSDEAETVLKTVPLQDQDTRYQGLVAQIELLKKAADTPEIQQLQQQVEQNPEDAALASQRHRRRAGREVPPSALLSAVLIATTPARAALSRATGSPPPAGG